MDNKTEQAQPDDRSKNLNHAEDQPQAVDVNQNSKPQVPQEHPEVAAARITAIASVAGALITAFVAFLAVWLPLNAEIDDLEEKIADLSSEIAERDTLIKSLNDQVNSSNFPLQEILDRDGQAQFEWQWAGENWYGRMVVEQQGNKNVITQAQVGLLEKNWVDETFMNGQVLNLVPDTGSINITDGGVIHLEFTANKKDRRLETERITFITGDLRQAVCYAGKVNFKYADTGEQFPGDMILVDYITPLGDRVDYWFSPNANQPWFDRYIIDR